MHMHLQISGYALDGDDGRMKGSDKCLKAGFNARWLPARPLPRGKVIPRQLETVNNRRFEINGQLISR
jgi:hypothetical protein